MIGRKYSSVVAIAGMVAGSVVAVGATPAAASSRPNLSGITIGSVVYSMDTVPFLAKLAQAEQQEAAKLGVTLKVVNGGGDATTQVSEMEQYIAEKVSLILLTNSNPTALVPAVKEANAAGIPVIPVNTPITSGMGAQVVTYVGDNDYTYGLDEGQMMVDALHGKGNVAMMLGELGTTPEVQRTAGIKKTFSENPGIHVVTTVIDEWQDALCLSVTQDLLTKYAAGSLQGIIAEGPEIYVGANYAWSIGRKNIIFIAGDYPTEVRNAIMSGRIYGAADQSPVLEGVEGVQAAVNWLTGHKNLVQQPDMYIPLPNVTKANVGQYPAQWTF